MVIDSFRIIMETDVFDLFLQLVTVSRLFMILCDRGDLPRKQFRQRFLQHRQSQIR